MSTPETKPKATTSQRALLLAMIFIPLMAPALFLAMTGYTSLVSACVYGGIIALVASFYSVRLSVVLSLVAGVSAFVAVVVEPYPLAGAIFMGLLAGGAALSARRGLHSAALIVPLAISLVLTAPPSITGVDSAFATGLIAAAVMAGSGLWVTLVSRLVLGSTAARLPRHEHSRNGSIAYALVMASVIGIATYVVLAVYPVDRGGWLILTLVVVLQPSTKDTVKKTLQRLGGTIAGLGIALLITLVDLPLWADLLGSALLLYVALTVQFVLRLPYGIYVMCLTPAILLMNVKAADALDLATKRLELTAVGAAIAIAVAFIAKIVLIELHRHRATPPG
ncbi:MAG: FUSC family protein [Actinomycetota bacterium]